MKQSLKTNSLIIFVATVASAFTSCGNESELFDEPVMYQTRAMTRMSMGSEGLGRWVRLEGSCNSRELDICNGIATAQIKITWEGYPNDGDQYVDATCIVTINYNYETTYEVKEIKKEYARIPNGEDAEAEFTVVLENTQTGGTITDRAHHNGFNVVKKGWLPNGSDTPIPMNINFTDSLTIQKL